MLKNCKFIKIVKFIFNNPNTSVHFYLFKLVNELIIYQFININNFIFCESILLFTQMS